MTDDRDRSDAVILTYRPAGRAERRERFEPRAGEGPDWERFEEVRREDGTWRTVGNELVETVAVENAPE